MVERVLCRRTDEDEDALLYRRQQRILPRGVEAMHLVQEQGRLTTVHGFIGLRQLDDLSHILDGSIYGVELHELTLCTVRYNVG